MKSLIHIYMYELSFSLHVWIILFLHTYELSFSLHVWLIIFLYTYESSFYLHVWIILFLYTYELSFFSTRMNYHFSLHVRSTYVLVNIKHQSCVFVVYLPVNTKGCLGWGSYKVKLIHSIINQLAKILKVVLINIHLSKENIRFISNINTH